jgi:hypothetical protein
MSTKSSQVCTIDCLLEGRFVSMASSLKSKHNFLYLEAKIYGKNVSCLNGRAATNSFMNPKLAKELGLTILESNKPVNMRFAIG